jgi:hypothetical protein
LIAPFAFLGPESGDRFTEVYMGIGPSNIYTKRFLITGALFEDGLADTSPLYHTIVRYLDDAMLVRIAEAYRKGRLLLFQTTDLDVGQPIVWNIGAIAASGRPRSATCFAGSHTVYSTRLRVNSRFLSAVMFDVEVNGRKHQEMHVNGGAVSQVFLVPPSHDSKTVLSRSDYKRKSVAYIVRNSRLPTDWSETQRQTLSITGKAVSTLINCNGVGDLYRDYLVTQRADASLSQHRPTARSRKCTCNAISHICLPRARS